MSSQNTSSRRLTDYSGVDLTVERVAGGGFGLVFMGPDRINGNRWYALKTVRPDLLARAPRLRDLFVREGITWVSLWPHANLLTAVAATVIDTQPFLELNYASYGSLRDLLQLDQPFRVRLLWAQMIAAGLDAIHTPDPQMLREQPLVHRDLKPENILVDEYGFAKITDFGLAKAVEEAATDDPGVLAALAAIEQQEAARMATAGGSADQRTRMAAAASRSRRYQTRRGAALGTLAYMPPEQWHDAAVVGPPADIYAFGLILSELLAGRHGLLDLEAGANERTWRETHERGTPRPLHGGPAEGASRLPQAVEDLYQRCLAKRPQDRPRAGECLSVLQRAAVGLGEKPYDVPDIYPRTDENIWKAAENISITYDQFDLIDEALVWSGRALAVPGAPPKVQINYGDILSELAQRAEQRGQAAEAERWAQRGLAAYAKAEAEISESEPAHWLAVARRAVLLSQRGRYAEAETAHAAVLAETPDDGTRWFNRALNERRWAMSEAQAGRDGDARMHVETGLDYLRRALDINPSNPSCLGLQQALRELLEQLGG